MIIVVKKQRPAFAGRFFRQPENLNENRYKNNVIVGSQQKQARQQAADNINNTARRSNAAWFCCESTIISPF